MGRLTQVHVVVFIQPARRIGAPDHPPRGIRPVCGRGWGAAPGLIGLTMLRSGLACRYSFRRKLKKKDSSLVWSLQPRAPDSRTECFVQHRGCVEYLALWQLATGEAQMASMPLHRELRRAKASHAVRAYVVCVRTSFADVRASTLTCSNRRNKWSVDNAPFDHRASV